jgi:hypothetical protein
MYLFDILYTLSLLEILEQRDSQPHQVLATLVSDKQSIRVNENESQGPVVVHVSTLHSVSGHLMSSIALRPLPLEPISCPYLHFCLSRFQRFWELLARVAFLFLTMAQFL